VSVSRVCYCTREDVQRAPDFKDSAGFATRIDRAIQTTSDVIEARMHRVFYPRDTTYKFDWPNEQLAPPWRFRFNQWDLVTATQVESPHGTTIPLGNVIFRPVNRKPGWPYTYMELDQSSVSAFSGGATPQLAIWVTGTWGFGADTDPAGTLAAAVVSTSATSITVSDGSLIGVGDLIIADTERMLVRDRAFTDTTISFGGIQTASDADNIVSVPSGSAFAIGEVIRADTEQMLITDIAGNDLVVTRGWNGTVLTEHTGGTVYAARALTVARGQYGTTAATHSNAAPVTRHRPPHAIRDLCIAEAVNQVLQETGGYARTTGEGDMVAAAPGAGLPDMWDAARTTYGRKARSRAI
jgi:hypothetical protein